MSLKIPKEEVTISETVIEYTNRGSDFEMPVLVFTYAFPILAFSKALSFLVFLKALLWLLFKHKYCSSSSNNMNFVVPVPGWQKIYFCKYSNITVIDND